MDLDNDENDPQKETSQNKRKDSMKLYYKTERKERKVIYVW